MLSAHAVSFSRNARGVVQIEFDDAVFARADAVFIDPSSRRVTGLLGELHFDIGVVSADMAQLFMTDSYVILRAPHPEGHDVSLPAPVLTIH